MAIIAINYLLTLLRYSLLIFVVFIVIAAETAIDATVGKK